MTRLEIGLEIRHRGVMSLCAIENKTAVVVVASYRSVSRNPVRFKALLKINALLPSQLNVTLQVNKRPSLKWGVSLTLKRK